MAEEASNIWIQESVRKHEKAAAEVATAKKVQGDARQDKIVITEMKEFVLGLQLNGETRKREAQDMFTYEDGDDSVTLAKDVVSRLAVIKEETRIEGQIKDGVVKPDEVLHEVAVGKGLAGALKFLQDRGTLNEGEGGDKTTNKKRSKPVGIEDGPKEIRIERTDEFGRVMTMKEAFRELSHKFHGKGPGKTKQEKRQRKYQDELKSKRMKSSDMPLMSTEKMRKAQACSKTPYIVLSGGAKSR